MEEDAGRLEPDDFPESLEEGFSFLLVLGGFGSANDGSLARLSLVRFEDLLEGVLSCDRFGAGGAGGDRRESIAFSDPCLRESEGLGVVCGLS